MQGRAKKLTETKLNRVTGKDRHFNWLVINTRTHVSTVWSGVTSTSTAFAVPPRVEPPGPRPPAPGTHEHVYLATSPEETLEYRSLSHKLCRTKDPSICLWYYRLLLKLFRIVKVNPVLSHTQFNIVTYFVCCYCFCFYFSAVLVHEPWPMPDIFVPGTATVEIRCNAKSSSRVFWSVDLGDDSTSLQYRAGDEELINHGVHELPEIPVPRTLRLLINDTARNNQTKVYCGGEQFTTLFVLGKL